MKQILIFLTLVVLVILSKAYTQSASWEVNPNDYEFSMSYSAVAIVNGEESTDVEDRLAAWVNGELRGVAAPFYVASTDRYYFFLLVYSNGSGEAVTFSFYDNSDLEIVDLKNEETFKSDNSEGSFSNPYIFTDEYAAGFRAFDFVGIEDEEVIIDSTQQTVIVQLGSNSAESLVATFEQAGATSVTVNGVEQESGVTVNDFTSPVSYVFIDAGGKEYTWTVEVMTTVSGLEDALENVGLEVYPSPTSGKVNIKAEERVEEIRVLSLTGEEVLQQENATEVDLQVLPSGIYFLKVKIGDEWGVRRVVKE